jgi:sulfotransferase 6B1
MAVLLNCLPKSGTHLARQCFELLLGPQKYVGHLDISQSDDELVARLVDLQGPVWCTAHLPFREPFAFMLSRFQQKHFVMIRDPRDVAVSFTSYVVREQQHALHSHYAALPSDGERLMTTLRGISESNQIGDLQLDDIGKTVQKFRAWLAIGAACEIRFERLVGPRGGGSHQDQISEIDRILDYLQLRLSREEISRVADQCFDRQSGTFRKGQIGDWQNHFSAEHKALCKEVAGDLLIDLRYERDLLW